MAKVEYRHGQKHGTWQMWDEQGQMIDESHHSSDKRDGTWKRWHSNGRPSMEASLVDGQFHGVQTEWHQNGQKKKSVRWNKGKSRSCKAWNEEGRSISCFAP